MPTKIGVFVGVYPYPVFIDRFIQALRKSGFSISVFGTILKKDNASSFIYGYRFYSFLNSSKFYFFVKTLVLLIITKPKDLIRFHKLKVANRGMNNLVKNYPILLNKPNVLHVQWASEIDQFLWVQEFGIKLVLSLRGAHINYSPLTVSGLAEKYKITFPKVDAFHGVSLAICHEASKYGASITKCSVVYSGFNIDEFPISTFKNHFESISKRPIKIISVGRAHWKKGYHFALDAVALLKSKSVDFKYDIIGASGVEELEFQRNQLELLNEVTFFKKVPFDEVKKRIREADVLLLPSVEEGIANVVLESMLLGTIVISTNCGGMEEVICDGENGYLVPVRSPERIAAALYRFSEESPEKLKEMLESAYKKVVEQHSESKMISDMSAMYNKVLIDEKQK